MSSSSSSGMARARRSPRATTTARGTASGGAADLTEFTFTGVGDKFRGLGGQRISQLNPDRTAGEPVLRGGLGPDAVGQGRGVPAEPRHPAQLRAGLPERRHLPAGECLDAGAALWVPVDSLELRLRLSVGKFHGAAVGCGGKHQGRGRARRASRRRRWASGSASTAIRRSGTWCGSVARSRGPTSITGGTTGRMRSPSRGATRASSRSTPSPRRCRLYLATGLAPGTYCESDHRRSVGLVLRRDYDRRRCRGIGATESRG